VIPHGGGDLLGIGMLTFRDDLQGRESRGRDAQSCTPERGIRVCGGVFMTVRQHAPIVRSFLD
jgi:hypothetical protein